MYILFHKGVSGEKGRFHFERRVRSGIEHWHLVIFGRNICLSWRWWSRDNSKNIDIIEMFQRLDKRVKYND